MMGLMKYEETGAPDNVGNVEADENRIVLFFHFLNLTIIRIMRVRVRAWGREQHYCHIMPISSKHVPTKVQIPLATEL